MRHLNFKPFKNRYQIICYQSGVSSKIKLAQCSLHQKFVISQYRNSTRKWHHSQSLSFVLFSTLNSTFHKSCERYMRAGMSTRYVWIIYQHFHVRHMLIKPAVFSLVFHNAITCFQIIHDLLGKFFLSFSFIFTCQHKQKDTHRVDTITVLCVKLLGLFLLYLHLSWSSQCERQNCNQEVRQQMSDSTTKTVKTLVWFLRYILISTRFSLLFRMQLYPMGPSECLERSLFAL